MIEEWKRREIIKDREEIFRMFPSIITYIAGKKNGQRVAEVFLHYEDQNAIEYFRRNADYSKVDKILFVDTAKKLEDENENLKEIWEFETSEPSIDKTSREKLREIIKYYGEKLMAKHSNIVGIGVSRVFSKGDFFRTPCIVLYCFDKALVPFGEQNMPTFLEGYPTDIREDFFTFGNCVGCPPFNHQCSIGRPFKKSAGSLGFFVKSKDPYFPEDGFLTAAHVALGEKHLSDLYHQNSILSERSRRYEIVHPAWIYNDTNDAIGNVSRAFCGSYGLGKTGIDAAFIHIYAPERGGKF